jgi:hypothetical protein
MTVTNVMPDGGLGMPQKAGNAPVNLVLFKAKVGQTRDHPVDLLRRHWRRFAAKASGRRGVLAWLIDHTCIRSGKNHFRRSRRCRSGRSSRKIENSISVKTTGAGTVGVRRNKASGQRRVAQQGRKPNR